MKRAMITGADGFIGRNLVWELLNHDYIVYAVVMNASAAKQTLGKQDRLHIIECDMNHYYTLVQYYELRNVPVLYHFSWAGVSDQLSTDYEIQLNNVKCSCDLQEAAAKLDIKRIVFADSIMEYEHQKAIEQGYYQVSMRNTYHIAKITARNLLQLRAANLQMEFIPLVISNIFGEGESSPRLINTAIRSMLSGTHMSFTSGTQLYDFIYIRDAVRAMRMAAEGGMNNKIYYIGNRVQIPLREYLLRMRDVLAPDMTLGLGELEMKGVSLEYNEFDTCGLYNDFGYEPEFTFEEGIRITADWIQTAEKGRKDENDNSSDSDL